ncbi:SPT3 Dosage dependent suppressor of Ty-induced promoter mutations-like protein [Podila horticola]|nr:SPT3 Dosage dependent suppressor of Ty-induced promoter mutations-like protein [Podila horticola]
MPPFSTPNNILHAMSQPDFDHSFMQQHEDLGKAELATSAWSNAQLYSLAPLASTPLRLNVKTHVFKKELQEYIPTQIEDRLRIETIIYVELSIIDQATGALANTYDYVRLPKDLFLTQADKVMSAEEMATKRILNIAATLQCPSNGWQEEKEACLRCARRMSAKSDATESRIMHMLPELHRTQEGDELISFRSGIANIQFKINCYCGHKREKEGFVIRFDSQSDASISSHVTLPLMFYHQNKNRVASRALAAAAKAQAKAEQQDQQSVARNIVKSVNSKLKREPRNHGGRGPIGENHQIPSPPNSLIDSPIQTWSSSPEMDEFMDSSDLPFTVPSPPPPDPALSLFHDNTTLSQEIQPKPQAMITHMTPNSGPTRGGTLVTIHGANFTVGEVVYVSFGQTLVPIFPQRDHILECFTPAAVKADTVPVFVVDTANDSHAAASASQITFTYVDDNEKELIKLALQRMMNITARMNGPLENVLHRANDFALWNDLLEGNSLDSSNNVYQHLEKMVLQSFELVDPVSSSVIKNCEHLSMVNSTGHTMLHLAVALQYQTLAKDLVDRGVDVEMTDKNGMTALDWARHVNNDALVALLSGMEVVVKDVSLMVVAKDHSGAHITGLIKGVEVAQHVQSLENPSVGLAPPPTDSPSGIVLHGQVDGSPPGHVKLQGITSGHDDPPMKIQWEGFGQGPGPVDTSVTMAGSKILDVNKILGLSDGSQRPHESEPVDVYQAQDLPDRREVALAKGQPSQDATSAIPLVHKYDASLMSAPNQDHSPVPQRRLPIAGVVVQSAGVSQEREMNIPILPVAGAICPIGGSTPVVRQPVGDLDHRAPCGPGVVADQGCPGSVEVPLKDAHLPPWSQTGSDMSVGVPGTSFGHQSAGIQQHESLSQEHQNSRIQSTSRIDVAVAGVRIPIQQNNDVAVRQDGDVVDVAVINHYSPTPAGVVGGVVVMDDVDNDVVGSSTVVEGVSVKQAAVQSGRFDVSEHPLFLGGLPVLPRDISRAKPPRTEIVQDQTMEGEHTEDEEQDGDNHDEVRKA